MIYPLIALAFFVWAFLDFVDLLFLRPPSSIKDGVLRNLSGYMKVAIGFLLLQFDK